MYMADPWITEDALCILNEGTPGVLLQTTSEVSYLNAGKKKGGGPIHDSLTAR